MFSAFLSLTFAGAGAVAGAFYNIKLHRLSVYRQLPEHPLMDLGVILDNPTQEMIDNSPIIWSEEHQQELIQVPQEVQCVVTGLTAGLLHELVPSVAALQRKQNAEARIAQRERLEAKIPGALQDSPVSRYSASDTGQRPQDFNEQALREREEEYLTTWEDEKIQLDRSVSQQIITDPLLLSNISDTQVFDTLVEKAPEKRDATGNVVQEAQYSLQREEKPHDNQSLGELVRLVDPLEGQFFCRRTHRYDPPWEFLKWRELERKRSLKARLLGVSEDEVVDADVDREQRDLMSGMVERLQREGMSGDGEDEEGGDGEDDERTGKFDTKSKKFQVYDDNDENNDEFDENFQEIKEKDKKNLTKNNSSSSLKKNKTNISTNKNNSTPNRPLSYKDDGLDGPILERDEFYKVVSTKETTPLSPLDLIRMSPTEALKHKNNVQMFKDQKLHLPKLGDKFPDVFLTLKRTQIPEEMFLPHTTHLSLSPNTELDKILQEGYLWSKTNQPRLVGLKREERVVPPLKHVTVIGEIYRDYDSTIRLRGMWDKSVNMYVEPVVTYKTRWELCDELEKDADKWLYGSVACYTISAMFGFKTILQTTQSLSMGD